MARDQLLILGLSLMLGTAVLASSTWLGQGFAQPPPQPLIVEAGCHQVSVIDLEDSAIEGRAKLCSTDDGMSLAMETENLVVGNAYTVWMGYFDRPIGCQWNPCGLGDALGDDPVGVLGRMDGRVADRSTEIFWGDFHGLRFSRGSQVILFLLAHGIAIADDNRYRARQLLTSQSHHFDASMSRSVPDGTTGSAAARAIFNVR
jgi:hypothetical protein